MAKFLAAAVMVNPKGGSSLTLLVEKLMEFDDVGTVVYDHPRTRKLPHLNFVLVTVLRLIASGLIELHFEEVANVAKYSLGMIAESPAYLTNDYWLLMYVVDR